MTHPRPPSLARPPPQANKYTKEEMKVAWESRKIMDAPDLRVSCTAVRIPTLRAHSEAITIEVRTYHLLEKGIQPNILHLLTKYRLRRRSMPMT